MRFRDKFDLTLIEDVPFYEIVMVVDFNGMSPQQKESYYEFLRNNFQKGTDDYAYHWRRDSDLYIIERHPRRY